MTAPNPEILTINPSKSKTWVAAVGGVLTIVIPLLLSVSSYFPDPWPAVIGAVVALLTALGVYKAPYRPEGTSVVSTADLQEVATPVAPAGEPPLPAIRPTPGLGGYSNPWR